MEKEVDLSNHADWSLSKKPRSRTWLKRFTAVMNPKTVGLIKAEPCVKECGIVIKPHVGLEEAPPLDTIVICSSSGFHGEKPNRRLLKWLKQRAPNTRRIAALGRGIYALAATGLLDGRQGVIHWRFAKDVAL